MKALSKISLLLIASITFLGSLSAQEITTRAVLDSTNILLGDQVILRLEVKQPQNAKIAFPSLSDTLTPNVEIVKRSKIDTVKLKNDRLHIYQNLTITSFDSGQHQIPPIYFKLDYDGLTDSLKTSPVTLNVHSFNVDLKKGITDIKTPYDAHITLKEASPYILGTIVALAVIFLILYAIRRSKRGVEQQGPPPRPLEPPHIIALRDLERVKQEALWKEEKIKQYYSELTDVVRTYIEYRFEVQAMESTTDEILADLTTNKNRLTKKAQEQLTQMLQLADLVKFAKYQPLPDDHQISLANAFFFVNETKIEVRKKPQENIDDREGEDVELK